MGTLLPFAILAFLNLSDMQTYLSERGKIKQNKTDPFVFIHICTVI